MIPNILLYLIIALGINIIMFIPAFIWKTDVLTDISYALSFIILAATALAFSRLSAAKIGLAVMILLWALRLGIFLFIRIRKMKTDKRFDGIRESFPKFLQFWVLQGLAVWIILIPTIYYMDTNRYCFSCEDSLLWIGVVIWLAGLITETLADLQKYRFSQDPKNKDRFISTGVWKYSRHPNYFGEMTCWAGIYLAVFLSLGTAEKIISLAGPAFIIVLLIFVTGLPPLEKFADQKWGKDKDYKEYKRKTSVLIPWLPKG